MKLATRLFIGVWLALIATLGVGVGLVAISFGSTSVERLPAPIVTAAAAALEQGGRAGLRSWLSENEVTLPYWRVYIVDDAGRELLDRSLPPRIRRWMGSWDTTLTRLGDVQYDPGRAMPSLVDGSGPRYWIVTLPPTSSPFRGFLFGSTGWLMIPLALAVTGLVSWFLAGSIARPLRKLTRRADAIRAGDFTSDTESGIARREDEIGTLSRSFDDAVTHVRQLLASREALLRDVSHELRSPLARMRVAIGLARQQGGDPASHLDRVEQETGRIEQLIAEILALSRLDGADRRLELTPLDLSEICDRVAGDAGFEGKARDQSIIWSPPDGVVLVHGNEYWLGAAIENLVRNGLRYGPPGRPVEIGLRIEGNRACVQVRDHGTGVAPQDLAMLFEPFFRTSGSRASHPDGTGLGLALVARVAALHGGQCLALNAPDGGFTVELWLPLQAR